MIANPTQSGHGLKLILNKAEASAVAVWLARTATGVAGHHQLRSQMLPLLSSFAWGDPDKWQQFDGAVLDGGTVVRQRARGAGAPREAT